MKNFLYLFLAAVIITASPSCKKDPTLPTVSTSQVSAITSNSVTGGGIITDDGNATILNCGLSYSLNETLSPSDQKVSAILNNNFSTQITGLVPGKTYYLRAYASNEVGTNYGEVISFNSGGLKPDATTLDAIVIDYWSATLNASVNPHDVETTVTFLYGTSENNLDKILTTSNINGNNILNVSADLSNLKDDMTYYFAVKSVNSLGTVIGQTKNFKTPQASLVDIDGNVYKIVKIGSQIWMAENLKVTHYNDGVAIPNITDNNAWVNQRTGAYCDYDNTPSNSEIYGRLYNCYTVWTGKLAPAGWHVPSEADWFLLCKNIQNDGGTLKETGYNHWWSPNTGATNSTGFTALPNGGRYGNNLYATPGYYNIHENSTWWSSETFTDPENAEEFILSYQTSLIYYSFSQKAKEGYGVRLIKD